MKRFIGVISLSVGLLALNGGVSAQESVTPVINADGESVTSSSGVNPVADAGGPTIVYGDLYPGPGTTVIGPPEGGSAPAPDPTGGSDVVMGPGTTGNITATDGDAATLGPGSASAAPGTVTRDGDPGTALLGPDGTYSVTEVPPSDVTVGATGAPAPVYEPAPVVETVETVEPEAAAEPVVADTAGASASDLDADNYADTLELEIGLDPGNPDTDGDAVADGDEVTIYLTDPFTWDSDGDGLSDGQELFASRTDPLMWDTNGDGIGDGEAAVL